MTMIRILQMDVFLPRTFLSRQLRAGSKELVRSNINTKSINRVSFNINN